MFFTVRILAAVTDTQQRIDHALQHLRCQLEHRSGWGVGVDVDFFVASASNHEVEYEVAWGKPEIAIANELVVNVERGPFAKEVVLNESRRRFENVADDVAPLLFRVGNVHLLIKAQQVGLPALFLQKLRYPSAAPTDAMFILIARRSQTVAGCGGNPRLGGVRKHIVESVARVLNAAPSFPCAAGDVWYPTRVGRANILDDVLVVNRLLINQKLCELTAT